ncbi:hypothetical protein [Streptomyces syringium]|uniref:hypothetical protein n=1 Tax=Streptomyces syringium TaxID=76729 RepID=UPI003408C997
MTTVNNHIGPGATIGGTVTQARDIRIMNGETFIDSHVAQPVRDGGELVLRLYEKMQEPGPVLALTTKGQAEALLDVIAIAGRARPDAAPMMNILAEQLRGRIAEHG